MWKDRPDMEDVHEYLRRLRRPRYEQLFREWHEEIDAKRSRREKSGQ